MWALELPEVDLPNTERGGWSSVCRLEVGDQAYYLKRQVNHLTLSWQRPLGEPTFAREMRNIQHYAALGVPALSAAFYAERKAEKSWRAILLTHALDGWQDLDQQLRDWPALSAVQQAASLCACAQLAARLHRAGLYHGCLYPKHLFLRVTETGFDACFIDLEKTRKSILKQRDRVRDIDALLRRVGSLWSAEQIELFLAEYLAVLGQTARAAWWRKALAKRYAHKART
nr:lipopolysaccharide kinase InaA family protein [Atopomonas sediminilitoris]